MKRRLAALCMVWCLLWTVVPTKGLTWPAWEEQRVYYINPLYADAVTEADLLTEHTYDLVLLDIMLPGIDGYELLRQIKPTGTPVIFITAKGSVQDRVQGLRAGADDYLVKPFEFAELLARLRALSRRSSQKLQQDVVEVGEFTLNRTVKVLKKGDMDVQLSPREFQIFDLLAQNLGFAVPREVILDRIWGLESDVSSNNIDSYVKLLRKKLDSVGGGSLIQTIRGVGYKLETE